MIAGVDEAGRGPVIGPMVICGICCDEKELNKVKVKDSKLLTPKKRDFIFQQLLNLNCKYVIRKIEPETIDTIRKFQSLNDLELSYFSEIIKELDCETVYVDAVDVNEERFGKNLALLVTNKFKIISKHKADSLYPIVSAASIIAKVTRDKEIESLKKELGDFGSGYPSDPKTIRFLNEYFAKFHKIPPYVRKSWKTLSFISKLENYK